MKIFEDILDLTWVFEQSERNGTTLLDEKGRAIPFSFTPLGNNRFSFIHNGSSHLIQIIKENEAKTVVKSKSMTTEEIELNEELEKNKIEVLETDLGEYIVQIAGEKPYHIVTPAMHKSKEDVAELFAEKFGTPKNSTPEYLTNNQEFIEELVENDTLALIAIDECHCVSNWGHSFRESYKKV